MKKTLTLIALLAILSMSAEAAERTFDANGNLLNKEEDQGLQYQWQDPRTGKIVTKSYPPANLHMRQVERRGNLVILEVERKIKFSEAGLQKPPTSVESDDSESDLVARCLDAAREMGGYKDPDSLKTEGQPLITFTPYKGAVRRAVTINVNAKNSYGAYGGSKPVGCIFAADNQTVLRVIN